MDIFQSYTFVFLIVCDIKSPFEFYMYLLELTVILVAICFFCRKMDC